MAQVDSTNDLGSYSALFARRKIWILTIVPSALLLSVFLAFALPTQYRSTATLFLEAAAIPDNFIKSTVRSYADEQIDIIQGRVLTTDALKGLVQEYDPYPDEPDLNADQKAQKIIQNVSLDHVDPVTFQPKDLAPAISIYYQNRDPRRASEVDTRIANLFLTYHQRARIDAARNASKIIQDRADELAKELQQADEAYARLREANGGTLPDLRNGGDEARYRAERDLTDLDRQLREAQQRESLLSIQLGGTSPNLLVTQGLATNGLPVTGAGAPATGLTDIATVKAELADAELRYTPDHPDVKRLKRALESLQAKQSAASASPLSADNPEYRRLAGELASAKADVAALQASTARARIQLAQYTANANPSSTLERQVADIDRRKQSLQTEYQETQDKLKSAELGQAAESGKNAEHFTMLQSPYPASQPYSPNRAGVIALGLVLGLMIAGGAVAIAESADATVRGARDLLSFEGLTVLANIPEIMLASDVRRNRLVWGSVLLIFLIAGVVDVVTIGRAQARVHKVEETVSAAAPASSMSPAIATSATSTSSPQ